MSCFAQQSEPIVDPYRWQPGRLNSLLLCSPQQPCSERALVKPVQSLRHVRSQQFVVVDRKQILGDEPDRFFRSHPMQAVKARQIYGPGECTQRALPPKVEISLEVAHRQFAQTAIDGLAIPASGVI